MFRVLLACLIVLFASMAMAQCYCDSGYVVVSPPPTVYVAPSTIYYSTTPVYSLPPVYVRPAPIYYVAPPVYYAPRPVYYSQPAYYAPRPVYNDATRGFFQAPPPLWVRGLRLGVMLSN